MKTISVIGSTGSIGKSSLEVVKNNPGEFSVYSLAAKNNVEELIRQAKVFKPKQVVIFDPAKKRELEQQLDSIEVLAGVDGLVQAATHPRVDQVLLALSGAEGLKPLIAAI